METQRDPLLWEIAQRRASFKHHLGSYIVFNIFFWLIWAFTGQHYSGNSHLPWPVWPMMGWGIGLFFHFLGAYVFPKENAAEREYQKLVKTKHEIH